MPGQQGRSGLLCLLLIAVIVAANYALPGRASAVTPAGSGFGVWTWVAWLITLAAMILMLRTIGVALKDRPAGVLIDNRNKISLSKFQMIGWTVLILSGIVTLEATMLADLAKAPQSLVIDPMLLTLMGISTTSLVAAPGVLSLKPAAQVESRSNVDKARWTDLFQGDGTADADTPDLSKIQQFLITLLVMAVFAFTMGNTFRYGVTGPYLELPRLGQDLIWLIGISHAGYLTYKAMPQTGGAGGARSGGRRGARTP